MGRVLNSLNTANGSKRRRGGNLERQKLNKSQQSFKISVWPYTITRWVNGEAQTTKQECFKLQWRRVKLEGSLYLNSFFSCFPSSHEEKRFGIKQQKNTNGFWQHRTTLKSLCFLNLIIFYLSTVSASSFMYIIFFLIKSLIWPNFKKTFVWKWWLTETKMYISLIRGEPFYGVTT